MRRAAALALLRRHPRPRRVRLELPGLNVVGEQRVERGVELGLERAGLDRHDDLDPVVEVAREQVGAAEEVAPARVGLEHEEAAVLEEPPEHAAHRDRLAHARHAGPQPADAARDDVDPRPGDGRAVELLDHLEVVQRVDLDPDPRPLALGGGLGDRADLLDEPAAHVNGDDQELAEALRACRSRSGS